MRRHLILPAICLALTAPAGAALACPWAGGHYRISDSGLYGDFTVNGDCSEIVWHWLQDDPQTSPLEVTKNGWKGEFRKGSAELLQNGSSVRIYGYGGVTRTTKAKPGS